jgi:hypothetical protein
MRIYRHGQAAAGSAIYTKYVYIATGGTAGGLWRRAWRLISGLRDLGYIRNTSICRDKGCNTHSLYFRGP